MRKTVRLRRMGMRLVSLVSEERADLHILGFPATFFPHPWPIRTEFRQNRSRLLMASPYESQSDKLA